MGKKYKLTISLLASNRKDTLPKCLESLKPILDNVSSELIVVDTGCDDELVEIIKKYTDKIEKFVWCKDFAKARNVGVDKAKGEWFMFIDDDEWFENVDEFIDFFNSGEEKKYGYGRYIVRNYSDWEGSKWEDAVVGRLFRLMNNARFVGAVHEYVYPTYGPVKAFMSYAHHYGYVYNTEEERLAHTRRNVELLVDAIKNNPSMARNYAHIYQEFSVIEDYEQSMKYTLMALENVDLTDGINHREMNSTYVNYVYVLMKEKKYNEAIKIGESFIAEKSLLKMAEAAIVGFLTGAYTMIGDYEKAVESADKFIKIKKYYDAHIEARYDDAVAMANSVFENENVCRVISLGLKAAVEMADIKKTYEYIEMFDWSKKVYMVEPGCVAKVADMAVESNDFSQNVKIFGKLCRQQIFNNILIGRIMEIKNENYEYYLKLCDIMSEINNQSGYVQIMKIIAIDKSGNVELLKNLYEKSVSTITDILAIDTEFYEIAIRRGIDIGSMIVKKPLAKWMCGIDQWADDVKIKEIITKKAYMDKLLPADSMHMKYLDVKVSELLLVRRKIKGLALATLLQELHNFAETELGFYRNIYSEQTFCQWKSLLPVGAQLALSILEAEKCVKNNEAEKAVAIINSMLGMKPEYAKVFGRYKELLEYNS